MTILLLNAVFEYDPRTLAIRHSGLCLGYFDDKETSYINIILQQCTSDSSSQQWYYDNSGSLQIRNVELGSSMCLLWYTIEGESNLSKFAQMMMWHSRHD